MKAIDEPADRRAPQYIDAYVMVSDGTETAEYHVWMPDSKLDFLASEIRVRMVKLGYDPGTIDVEVSPGGEYDLVMAPGRHIVSMAREIVELSGFCDQRD